MSYKLKFYCLGNPVQGQNYKVYQRYYIDRKTLNIPTDYTLTKDQTQLLNKGELGGAIQTDLDKQRAILIQAIETLNLMHNTYPTPEVLKDFLNDIKEALPMEYYVSEFLKQMKIKKQSKAIYDDHLSHWLKYYELNLTKTPIEHLIKKETVEKFGEWVAKKGSMLKKINYSDVSLYNIKGTAYRLLNYIAETKHLHKIDAYLVTPRSNTKFTPTEEQFNRLVTVNVGDSKVLQMVQDMVFVNGCKQKLTMQENGK